MKYRILSVSAVFVTTVIGAGFASGREIALYFADTSIFTPILAGIFLGVFCYLFLILGMYKNGNIMPIFGKAKTFVSVAIFLSNFITFCAMIAASEDVIFSLFRIRGGSIITGILALIVVKAGIEKLKFISFLSLPLIIALVFFLFFKSGEMPPFVRVAILPAFMYTAMNIISAGYLISTFSGGFSRKECVAISSVSGVILTVLLVTVFCCIQHNLNDAMPLPTVADNSGAHIAGSLVMYLAVFTTVISCLSVSSKDNIKTALLLTSAAFIVATFGFEKLVNNLYPVLGGLGAVISVYCVFAAIKIRKNVTEKLTCKIDRNKPEKLTGKIVSTN